PSKQASAPTQVIAQKREIYCRPREVRSPWGVHVTSDMSPADLLLEIKRALESVRGCQWEADKHWMFLLHCGWIETLSIDNSNSGNTDAHAAATTKRSSPKDLLLQWEMEDTAFVTPPPPPTLPPSQSVVFLLRERRRRGVVLFRFMHLLLLTRGATERRQIAPTLAISLLPVLLTTDLYSHNQCLYLPPPCTYTYTYTHIPPPAATDNAMTTTGMAMCSLDLLSARSPLSDCSPILTLFPGILSQGAHTHIHTKLTVKLCEFCVASLALVCRLDQSFAAPCPAPHYCAVVFLIFSYYLSFFSVFENRIKSRSQSLLIEYERLFSFVNNNNNPMSAYVCDTVNCRHFLRV
ncbi:unnamed protein product, partial [Dibothriocephalus latus]